MRADVERQPLAAINDVFTRLEYGDVPSRVVLDFGGHASPRPDAVPSSELLPQAGVYDSAVDRSSGG